MQKSMKKGKYTHNLIPRNTFLMGSPQAAGSLIHRQPLMSRDKNTRPSLTPFIFPSTLFHPVPERLTDGCKTMDRSLISLDLSYHFTTVWKMSWDLSVTHWALRAVLSASHTLSQWKCFVNLQALAQTTVWEVIMSSGFVLMTVYFSEGRGSVGGMYLTLNKELGIKW